MMSTNTLNIKCELNIDDAIAWNYYYLENGVQWKKNWNLIHFIFMPIMAICFIFSIIYLISGINKSIVNTIITGGIGVIVGGGGFLYFVLYPDMLRRKIRKTSSIVYSRGENRLIGTHSFIISADGITDNNNIVAKWVAVDDIVQTDAHIFVLVHPNKAVIIPKRAFPDAVALGRFVQDVQDIFHSVQKTN